MRKEKKSTKTALYFQMSNFFALMFIIENRCAFREIRPFCDVHDLHIFFHSRIKEPFLTYLFLYFWTQFLYEI